MQSRVYFVDFVGYFQAALDLGVTLDDGIRELMDNACDAGARKINVIIEQITHPTERDPHTNKPLEGIRLYVVDDGCGIPKVIRDSEGKLFPGLPFAMSFGGRGEDDVFINGHKKRIGKFGEGLSATLSCLANERGRAVVWTKQASDDAWRHVPFDYTSIVNNDCLLPNESTTLEPDYLPSDPTNGTVVRIDTYEGHRKRLGNLQNMLTEYTARTYRHRMAEGLEIRITVEPKGTHIDTRIRDPLFRLDGSEEVERFGKAHVFDPVVLVFDGEDKDLNPVGEYGFIPDENGDPVEVRLEVSWINPLAIDRHLFPDATKRVEEKNRNKQLRRWGIGNRGQGFSFIRDGREIVRNRSRGLYQRHPDLNYMHGEIHFPPELDELFGIQTNKSRFSVDKELQEVLAEEIATVITQVRKMQAGTADERRAVRVGIMESDAEANLRTLASRLPVPIYTEADLDKGRAFRDSMRQKLVTKLQTGYERKIQKLESERNQRSEEDHLNEQHRQAQLLEEYIRRVEARFGSRAPLRFDHREDGDCEDNALYDVDIQGDETVVYVQKSSPLYTSLASSIENQPSLAYALKLMLGSLAYAEHMDCAMDSNNVAIWEDVRHDISAKLHAMLPVLEQAMAEQEVDE